MHTLTVWPHAEHAFRDSACLQLPPVTDPCAAVGASRPPARSARSSSAGAAAWPRPEGSGARSRGSTVESGEESLTEIDQFPNLQKTGSISTYNDILYRLCWRIWSKHLIGLHCNIDRCPQLRAPNGCSIVLRACLFRERQRFRVVFPSEPGPVKLHAAGRTTLRTLRTPPKNI